MCRWYCTEKMGVCVYKHTKRNGTKINETKRNKTQQNETAVLENQQSRENVQMVLHGKTGGRENGGDRAPYIRTRYETVRIVHPEKRNGTTKKKKRNGTERNETSVLDNQQLGKYVKDGITLHGENGSLHKQEHETARKKKEPKRNETKWFFLKISSCGALGRCVQMTDGTARRNWETGKRRDGHVIHTRQE